MQKLTDIVISEDGQETTYSVGPLKFGAVMKSRALKRLAGFDKATGAAREEDNDLPAEDRQAQVQKMIDEGDVDVLELMPVVICGTVRKIDGERVEMTPGDVDDLSLPHATSLFQAIFEALGLKEGGRLATTFRVQSGGDAEAREGV